MITERRSYVAGRWVEGDEVARRSRTRPTRSSVAELSVTPIAEVERAIDEARRAFDEGPWADRCRRRAGPRSCTRCSTTSRRTATTLVADDGGRGRPADDVRRGRCSSRSGLGARPATTDRPLPVDGARGGEPGARSTSSSRGRVALSVRRHEPVGVVAAITPYNARDHHGVPEADPGADGRQLGDPAAEPAHAASRR